MAFCTTREYIIFSGVIISWFRFKNITLVCLKLKKYTKHFETSKGYQIDRIKLDNNLVLSLKIWRNSVIGESMEVQKLTQISQ